MFLMKNTNNKEDVNIQKLYGKEGTLPKEEFLKAYNIDINGLSSAEAKARQVIYFKWCLSLKKGKCGNVDKPGM